MKATRTVFGIAVFLVLSWSGVAAAQEITKRPERVATYELALRDGSRMYGSVEQETDTDVVFRTTSGALITAPRREILSLRTVDGTVRDGEFMREDPNTTRLFFGPTGRALPKGKAYLGVYEFLLPFVQVGVTDRFSIGGGTPLIFTSEDWHRPFWITPKLEVFRGGSTHVSAGAFLGFGEGSSAGIAYGVFTHGTPDASLTAGVGMAYASDGGRAPVVMVGGERRIRRNLKVITENYLWKGGNGFVSGGFRLFGEQLSADIALAVPIGTDSLIAFPLVNFVYVF